MSLLKSIGAKLATIFARPHYCSEHTAFIEALKAQDPALSKRQSAGRALLWDIDVNPELRQEFDRAKQAQQAYVYQTTPSA
jgi:Protein of unknown function (DUF3460)